MIKAVCGTLCGSAGGATGADAEGAADPEAAAAVRAVSDGGFVVEAASDEEFPGAALGDRGVTVCVRLT